jgi:hypothetical protein
VSTADYNAGAGGLRERNQLLQPEGRGNGSRTIVDRQGAPSQDGSRNGEKAVSNRVALEIEQKQSAAGELAQSRDHLNRLAIGKMMQHRRAKDEVEGMLSKGKLKRIRYHPHSWSVPQVERPMVDRDDLRVGVTADQASGHISGARSHIEQGEALVRMYQIPHHPKQNPMAAKPPVDAGQFAQIASCVRRPGTLQQLGL